MAMLVGDREFDFSIRQVVMWFRVLGLVYEEATFGQGDALLIGWAVDSCSGSIPIRESEYFKEFVVAETAYMVDDQRMTRGTKLSRPSGIPQAAISMSGCWSK